MNGQHMETQGNDQTSHEAGTPSRQNTSSLDNNTSICSRCQHVKNDKIFFELGIPLIGYTMIIILRPQLLPGYSRSAIGRSRLPHDRFRSARDRSKSARDRLKYTRNRSKSTRRPTKYSHDRSKFDRFRSHNTDLALPPNKKGRNNFSSIIKAFIVFSIWTLAIYSIYVRMDTSYSDACDINKAANRDFNSFYGIDNSKNHFTKHTTTECDDAYIFESIFPQSVLESSHLASSFMTLAPYGTGKTLLRCEYYKSLRSDTYFKVLILNKQTTEYLERFIKEKAMSGTDCEKENCMLKWSKNEFGQLLLSLLVTQFVNTFEKEQFDLPDISLDEKFELITIICYYYNQPGVSKLEKFVNSFLKKTGDSIYSASKAEIKIKERHLFQDKPLLAHLKNDLKNSSPLRQDSEKLHLLLAIAEGEGFQTKALKTTMSNNMFNDLTHFTVFMKNHLKKTVVFIIDELDGNRYFFQQNAVNKVSLELFYRSSISQEILSAIMSQNFYLSLFYPKIDGVDIQQAIIRKDEFPIYSIDWGTKSLIKYADYVLQEMNKNASASRCKSLKDFKTLVNYANKKNAEIIDQIPTPRALHYFMQNLIIEMNHCANDGQEPFIATFDNVNNAFKKSIEYTHEHHTIHAIKE